MTVVATRPRRDTRLPGSARNRGCRRPAVATASPGPPWGRCVHASRRNLRRWQGPRRRNRYSGISFLRGPWLCPLPRIQIPAGKGAALPEPQLHTIRCTGQETLRRCTIGDYGWRPRRQHCCCARAPSNHRVRLDGEQRQRAEIEQSARCRSCPCANLERRRAGREMASVTLSFKYSIRVAWPCRMIAAGIVAEGDSTEFLVDARFAHAARSPPASPAD